MGVAQRGLEDDQEVVWTFKQNVDNVVCLPALLLDCGFTLERIEVKMLVLIGQLIESICLTRFWDEESGFCFRIG